MGYHRCLHIVVETETSGWFCHWIPLMLFCETFLFSGSHPSLSCIIQWSAVTTITYLRYHGSKFTCEPIKRDQSSIIQRGGLTQDIRQGHSAFKYGIQFIIAGNTVHYKPLNNLLISFVIDLLIEEVLQGSLFLKNTVCCLYKFDRVVVVSPFWLSDSIENVS